MIVLPEEFLNNWWTWFLDVLTASSEISVHLYQNDVTPDFDTVIGDLTECDFGGYTSMPAADWVVEGPHNPIVRGQTLTDVIWTVTSGANIPQTVYGYWVVDATYGTLWVERSPSPITLSAIGNSVALRPSFDFGNCP